MKRGYFGSGVYNPKTTENIEKLWRSAHNFGADFIFTVGARYKKQPSDTTKAERHIPLYVYEDFEDYRKHLPTTAELIFIEQSDKSKSITDFKHPEQAIYLLDAEDSGVPEDLMRTFQVVHIDTPMCLNVAVAGSLV